MKKIIVEVLFIIFSCHLSAQELSNNEHFYVVRGIIVDNDTIPYIELAPFVVFPEKVFNSNKEYIHYTRLMANVKKVYPYAKVAGNKLKEYAPILDTLKTKKEKDRYFKVIEDQLMAEYGSTLKKFSVTQGAILIKLVDRECQRSTYQVIKDFRGGFSAFFYQTFARLWGYNLKIKYEPKGADAEIEDIVIRIEAGNI